MNAASTTQQYASACCRIEVAEETAQELELEPELEPLPELPGTQSSFNLTKVSPRMTEEIVQSGEPLWYSLLYG